MFNNNISEMANQSPYNNRVIVENYIHQKLSKRGLEWGSDGGREHNSPVNGLVDDRSAVLTRRFGPGLGPLRGPGPQPDPHAKLHKILREAGDEIERRHRRDFEDMSAQLHLTPNSAEIKFAAVIEELFRDGVNWGRIIAFFEFGGTLCVESVNRQMTSQVDNIANWMTEYLNGPLQTWIQENGGWDAFVELYSGQRDPEAGCSWPYLRTIVTLAAVGVAGVTFSSYFTQQ